MTPATSSACAATSCRPSTSSAPFPPDRRPPFGPGRSGHSALRTRAGSRPTLAAMTWTDHARRLGRGVALGMALLAVLPATASAHQLTGRYESPLPLAAYLGGAAIAVALSFAIVILRTRASSATAEPDEPRAVIPVRRGFRLALRAIGLIAYLWIVVQGIVGGESSDADVGSLFLWTY